MPRKIASKPVPPYHGGVIRDTPLDGLKPHPSNPRRGNVEKIADSIRRHGFHGVLVGQESSGFIIAGEHRWRALRRLGGRPVEWDENGEPSKLVQDVPVDWRDVGDREALEIMLADNRASDVAAYDPDVLSSLLNEMPDPSAALYDQPDIEAILASMRPEVTVHEHKRNAVRPAETPDGSAEVIQGDARVLDGIADGSVDLIVTSPPYFALRSYRDGGEHYAGQMGSEGSPEEWLDALWACTATWWAKLKPSGSLWVNLGDKYAASRMDGSNHKGISSNPATARGLVVRDEEARKGTGVDATTSVREKSLIGMPWRYALGCIDGRAAPDGQRWILRAEVIWHKVNSLPESVSDRVRRSHEQWFHLVKSEHYYAAIDEVREPHETFTTATGTVRYRRPEDGDQPGEPLLDPKFTIYGDDETGRMGNRGHFGAMNRGNDPLGRVPGSVWTVPSEPLIVPDGFPEHFAAFPQEFPRRIILGWSPPAWCDGCGEPRRPVVEKSLEGVWHDKPLVDSRYDDDPTQAGAHPRYQAFGSTEARVLGYSCGCDDPDAPTSRSVVLDPFGGTGTTAMVARALGRHGVSVDLSADYCRLAQWRIFDSGHWQKSIDRTREDGARSDA